MIKAYRQLSVIKPSLLQTTERIYQNSAYYNFEYLFNYHEPSCFSRHVLPTNLVTQIQQMQSIIPKYDPPVEMIYYASEISSIVARVIHQMEPLLSSYFHLTASIATAIQPTLREISTLISQLDPKLFEPDYFENLLSQYQAQLEITDIQNEDTSFLDTDQLYEDLQPFFQGIDLRKQFLEYFPEFQWGPFLCWVVNTIIIPTIIAFAVAKYTSPPLTQTIIEKQIIIEHQTLNITQSSAHISVPEKHNISTNWKRSGKRKRTKTR